MIEYKMSYRSKEELSDILYNLSLDMKKHHKNGEYITDFSPRTISICWTNHSSAFFTKYTRFSQMSLTDIVELKISNIRMLALLAFCLFLDDYDLENGLLNFEVVKNNIQNNLNLFLERDRNYYKDIFTNEKINYYCDYVNSVLGDSIVDKKNNYNSMGMVSIVLLISSILSTVTILGFIYFFIK